jgi:hypothetical protein
MYQAVIGGINIVLWWTIFPQWEWMSGLLQRQVANSLYRSRWTKFHGVAQGSQPAHF